MLNVTHASAANVAGVMKLAISSDDVSVGTESRRMESAKDGPVIKTTSAKRMCKRATDVRHAKRMVIRAARKKKMDDDGGIEEGEHPIPAAYVRA